jgi:hypothetical protein
MSFYHAVVWIDHKQARVIRFSDEESQSVQVAHEGGEAHLFDLGFVGDSELSFGFEFGGQSVRVPAKSAVNLLAAHRLVTRE